MKDFLSDVAQNIMPYVAGEQPKGKNIIKLNTNENPFPPSPRVANVIKKFDASNLKKYPDPTAIELRKAIAKAKGVSEKNVFVGNGSDEVLSFCFKAFFNPKSEDIVFPDVTYSFYPVFANLYEINYRVMPLKANFEVDVNDYLTLDDDVCQGIVLANPNAPTGMKVAEMGNLEMLIKANSNKVVVIDEAYSDFAKVSAIPLTKMFKNLVVVQTFSKSYSLAGIRCGYAIADEYLIEGLNRIKDCFNSYPLDAITQSVCTEAVADTAYYAKCTDLVIKAREYTTKALTEMDFQVLPSATNFVLAKHKTTNAKEIFEMLKTQGIFVRYFDKPRINNFLRITIGTLPEMQKVVKTLKKYITTTQKSKESTAKNTTTKTTKK